MKVQSWDWKKIRTGLDLDQSGLEIFGLDWTATAVRSSVSYIFGNLRTDPGPVVTGHDRLSAPLSCVTIIEFLLILILILLIFSLTIDVIA